MPFVWSRTAREEYLDAIRWHESASDGLASAFPGWSEQCSTRSLKIPSASRFHLMVHDTPESKTSLTVYTTFSEKGRLSS